MVLLLFFFVACGSTSIVDLLLFMAPVSVVHGSILQYLLSVNRLWLQYLLLLVAPVSSVGRLVLWIQYLSFMAPVSPVACLWLQYLLLLWLRRSWLQ